MLQQTSFFTAMVSNVVISSTNHVIHFFDDHLYSRHQIEEVDSLLDSVRDSSNGQPVSARPGFFRSGQMHEQLQWHGPVDRSED